jgi:hypothetical protein
MISKTIHFVKVVERELVDLKGLETAGCGTGDRGPKAGNDERDDRQTALRPVTYRSG